MPAISISRPGAHTSRAQVPVFDHNGNIHKLVDADSNTVVAEYQYSPFGILIDKWGPAADECPFLFQTKYYDSEVELYYYGYRYYNPKDGKWLSRDPLGEAGGLNMMAFCGNDPINCWDYLGLEAFYAADDKDALFFQLAAESQSLHKAPKLGEEKKAFRERLIQEKTNPEKTGPIFIGTEPVVAISNKTKPRDLKSTTGKWYLYGHGNTGFVNIYGGKENKLTPDVVKAEKIGDQSNIEYVWSIACRFGNDIENWQNAFGPKTTVVGSKDLVHATIVPIVEFRDYTLKEKFQRGTATDGWTPPFDKQAIINEFGALLERVSYSPLPVPNADTDSKKTFTYQDFIKEWDALYNKHKANLKFAYWHIYDSDYTTTQNWKVLNGN
jgi:RHS repeat-associated protein